MPDIIDSLAKQIYEADQKRTPIQPIHDQLEPKNLEQAYAVQEVNTKRRLSEGRRLVGRKIGFTNVVVQKQLGVNEPDYGMLFHDMAVSDGWEVPRNRLIQPKVEAEIAFVVGKDLNDERLTVVDIIRATEFVVPAIEIVDSRIADWKIDIVDTISDNASAALYVLGGTPKKLDQVDLRQCGMVMQTNNNQVSYGAGTMCMGDPLTAVLWLARTMARVGRPLQAGDTVLSGSLGLMSTVAWGSVYEAQISGIGSVRAAFAKD